MKKVNKYIQKFYCAICKKLKHKNKLKIVAPITLHCNKCIKE